MTKQELVFNLRKEAEEFMIKNYSSAKEEGYADPYYKSGYVDYYLKNILGVEDIGKFYEEMNNER